MSTPYFFPGISLSWSMQYRTDQQIGCPHSQGMPIASRSRLQHHAARRYAMNPVPRLLVATFALCTAGAIHAAAADASQAAGRCESEVADTIKRMRGKEVAGVQFTAGAR